MENNRNSDSLAGHIVRATSSGEMNAPKIVCKKVHFSFFMLIQTQFLVCFFSPEANTVTKAKVKILFSSAILLAKILNSVFCT